MAAVYSAVVQPFRSLVATTTGVAVPVALKAAATAVSVWMAYTSARSRMRMSHAPGLVQSMSWREMSTVPP